MFPTTATPLHDTSSASALLKAYYAARSDFFEVYELDQREAVFGTDAAEYLEGGAGADALDGNVADPAQGGDILAGGAGSDIYFLSDNQTRIIEAAGDEGVDCVVTNVSFDLAAHSDGAGGAAHIERVEIWGETDLTVDGSAATWEMGTKVVGTGNYTIKTGSGNDILMAGTGHDVLDAGAGNDEIWGYEGNDVLYGGDGDDLVCGGEGDDWMTGGAGADRFVLRHSEGPQMDVISGFQKGIDKVEIYDADMFEYSFFQTPDGVMMTYGVDRAVLFEGTTRYDVSMKDFVFEEEYGSY